MTIVIWTGVCLLALVSLRRRLAPGPLSPVVLVTMSMLALVAGGVLFYQDVATAPSGAGVQLSISDALSERTARLLLLSASAFLLGAAAGLSRAPASRPGWRAARPTLQPGTVKIVLAVCALPIAYTLVNPGVNPLLERPLYIDNAFGGGSMAIANQLGIAGVVVLGYVVASVRGGMRAFAITLAVLYALIFFAAGSRRFALTPLLFALGTYTASPGRRSRAGLILTAPLSLYLIRLPLFLRNQDDHGLLPYLTRLPAFFGDSTGWDEVGRNVLISFAIIAVTAYVQPHLPIHDLWVSLNPAPGALAGWYDIAPIHRLNDFTPYAAVGELGNAGPWAVIGYFFVLGLVMAHLERRVRHLLVGGRPAHALLIVGLVGLFCLFNQQYNLRQSTRMVLYALVLDLALSAISWLTTRPARPSTADLAMHQPADDPVPGTADAQRMHPRSRDTGNASSGAHEPCRPPADGNPSSGGGPASPIPTSHQ